MIVIRIPLFCFNLIFSCIPDTMSSDLHIWVILVLFAPLTYCPLLFHTSIKVGLPWCLSGIKSARQCRRHTFDLWVRKIAWRRKWQPTPVFLPRKSHGQRRLAGYSPWRCKRVRDGLVTKQPWTLGLEKEMATHSSILAWRTLWMEEPGGLLSMVLHRVGHDWSDLAAAAALG